MNKQKCQQIADEGRARIDAMLADGAARRLGFSLDERNAYYEAVAASPAAIYSTNGKTMRPVRTHDIGMRAVEAFRASN